MAKVNPICHIWSLEFNQYVCFSFRDSWNTDGQGHQSCQKWKKYNFFFLSYRMNKSLQSKAEHAAA